VAAYAGVSVATVSRVMNDKDDVSDLARERVRAAVRELGYRPDAAARALVSQRTRRIAVVIGESCGRRDLTMLFFGRVLTAISRRLADARYDTLLLTPPDSQRPASPLDPRHGRRFDGAIVVGLDEGDAAIRELAAAGVPLVGIDVRLDGPRCGCVASDHAEGIRLAVRHLYALGHRRIAHIAGAETTLAGPERLRAFRAEAQTLGLELPDEYLRRGDFSSGSGYREACALLASDAPPTAIVAASDLMALAALQAGWDFGLEPGRDVAVTGFDDLEPAALAHPPLTTIRQDRDALGTLAATQAIELVERPDGAARTTLVPVELVVRASTAAARATPVS
jgi:LacI family transcriptional regulator